MRSIKALITLILLGVVFSNTPAGVATAKIMNSTNEPTIDEFVDLILAEKITVPEVDAFLKGLNETQYEEFVKVFAERVGVDKKELQEEADEYNQITSPDKSLPGENPRTAAPNAVWNDTIENTWTISVNGPFSLFWYEDGNCDGDSSDNEYVFYYGFPSSSPESIRWSTTAAQVYAAFAVYNWNLLGFGYNFDEVRLCIGDSGVALAGGPDVVRDTVYIHR
jgi:hypothetical protein